MYKRACSTCLYGNSPDPLSAFCDECQCEPDTGFGGFTDNSYIDECGNRGIHFNSQSEADRFYQRENNRFEKDNRSFVDRYQPCGRPIRETLKRQIDFLYMPNSMW